MTKSKRSSRKPRVQTKPIRARKRTESGRVYWKDSLASFERAGIDARRTKRYYGIETLSHATEKAIASRTFFLRASLRRVLGPEPPASLSFDLVQENTYSLVFNVLAIAAGRKRRRLRFVIAKNAQEHSAALQSEHRCLQHVHRRTPRCVLAPLGSGTIFLPDRYRRTSEARELFGYATEPSSGFFELALGSRGHLMLCKRSPVTLTGHESQALRRRVLEIILRSYDTRSRECIAIPEIDQGHLVATRDASGRTQLKLAGCTRMLSRVTPARLVQILCEGTWRDRGGGQPVAPGDPAEVLQAFSNAVGADVAKRWLAQYRDRVEKGRMPETGRMPLDFLATLSLKTNKS